MATMSREVAGQTALVGGDVPSKTLDEIECEHLARWIVRNGSNPPTISRAWLDAARRMREIDGRTHEQVMAAIDWCQRSEFWCTNIRSMPKLRERYETLRSQAKRERERARRPSEPMRTQRQAASDVRRRIAMGEV